MTMATDAGGPTEVDPEQVIPAARLAGRPLLLMLDVDGTLAPIAPRPSLARVPDETREILAELARRPRVFVVIVSGRAAHDARRMVGVENVWTIGNHGAEVIGPSGEVTVDPAVARYAIPMGRVAQTLQPVLAEIDGVVLENKEWTLSVHYRLVDDAAVVLRLQDLVTDSAERNGLLVTQGKRVIEIRSPANVDKGTAIRRLAERLGAFSPDASLLFAGDDATDEDAFQMLRAELPRAVTIHVGDDAMTAAEFSLATPERVRALLERIARDTTSEQ
jgi:trehalose 6-phosphate phosphatase